MARVWARPANLAGSTWSPSEFVNLVYHCYVTNNLILGYFLGLSDNKIVTKINHVVTHHSPTYFKDFSHDDDSDSDVPLPLPDLLSSTVEEPALFNLEITMRRNLNRFGGKNLKRFRFILQFGVRSSGADWSGPRIDVWWSKGSDAWWR